MKTYLLPLDGTFYKANLHCHSTVSDGTRTPAELKAEYMEKGYSIIAYTDHDIMIHHPELIDGQFLALEAFEVEINEETDAPWKQQKTCHLCFVALREGVKQVCYHRTKYLKESSEVYRPMAKFDESEPDYERHYTPECINDMIKRARDEGFFVTYNHPTWSEESYPEYMAYEGMHAMEIVNYSSQSIGYDEYNPRVFDDMLRGGKCVLCSACDDNHNFKAAGSLAYDSFGGFNMIKAKSLTLEAVGDALLQGHFYASEAPEIYELTVEDGKVHIKCSPAREISIITKSRRNQVVWRTEDENGAYIPVTEATFTVSADDGYFRLTVTDEDGRHACTQAYDAETYKIANS